MTAVGRFTFTPVGYEPIPCDETATVQHYVFTEGMDPTEDNRCQIDRLCPDVEYKVVFDVLRNDLGDEGEGHVVSVELDDWTMDNNARTEDITCQPDAGDVGCTFYTCPY